MENRNEGSLSTEKRKKKHNNSDNYNQLKCFGNLFILQNKCHESHQLAFKRDSKKIIRKVIPCGFATI